MQDGCAKDDYVVFISQIPCTDLDLTDNDLSCKPPEDEPELLNRTHAGHQVQV